MGEVAGRENMGYGDAAHAGDGHGWDGDSGDSVGEDGTHPEM